MVLPILTQVKPLLWIQAGGRDELTLDQECLHLRSEGHIVSGMHDRRAHRPKNASAKGASSKGRIVQGSRIVQETTHRPRDASSKRHIVQETHRPRTNVWGKISQGQTKAFFIMTQLYWLPRHIHRSHLLYLYILIWAGGPINFCSFQHMFLCE